MRWSTHGLPLVYRYLYHFELDRSVWSFKEISSVDHFPLKMEQLIIICTFKHVKCFFCFLECQQSHRLLYSFSYECKVLIAKHWRKNCWWLPYFKFVVQDCPCCPINGSVAKKKQLLLQIYAEVEGKKHSFVLI